MLSPELMAEVKEATRQDARKIVAALKERVGAEFMRSVYQVDLAETVTNSDGERPRFRQASEFLTWAGDVPPMIVEGLIPQNKLIIVSSKPKAGKTYLGLDFADCVATGTPFGGVHAVNTPGAVAYLAMEDGATEIKDRLEKRGLTPDDTGIGVYICTDRIVLPTEEGMALLGLMVSEIPSPPVAVVIDTAREGLGIKDWRNEAEVADRLRPLREFAHRVCTVILIAHNRKAEGEGGDEIGGTNSFTSSVDGWISFNRSERRPNGNRRLYGEAVGRGGMNGSLVVEMDTNNLHFRALTEEDIAGERQERWDAAKQQKYARVLDAMGAKGGRCTVQAVCDILGSDYETTRKTMQEAAADGVIVDTGERERVSGKKGRVVYRIADSRGNRPFELVPPPGDTDAP